MTEPATLDLDLPKPVVAPIRHLPESVVVDMLVQRHTKISMNAHRYAFADHVPNKPWGAARICDFVAIDCYNGFAQPQHPIHGFEIKASRADWLSELRQPDKAEAFKPYFDHWWLVVTDLRICPLDELPAGWGLLTVAGDKLRKVKAAPVLQPEPMPRPLFAAITRAVAKTARRAQPESRTA